MSELSGDMLSNPATGSWPPASLSRDSLVKNPIRTDRLVLRPLEAADADDVWRYQRDAEILRYIPWPERTREEARAHTERRATASGSLAGDGDHVFLAVELAAGSEAGRVIGDVMLRIVSTVKAEVEIGWVFARDQHGRGYASEAASAALRLAFDGFEAHRVVAHLDDRNTASAVLCNRLGMRHEGTSFEQEWEPGGWINLELHGIDREEWSARASGSPAPREHSPNPVPPAVPSEIPPAHFEIPYDFAVLAVVPMPTERLEIRCYRDADASDLHTLMGDPEVTRFLPRGPMSMTEALGVAVQNAQNTALANDGDVVKLVLEFEGRFAGQAKLELASIEDHVLEIGWTLAPVFQGRGIATEAATALLDLAVHTIGTHRVIAHIYPDNRPSAALATRLGMRLERLSRSDWPEPDGNWTDTAVYAITAAEWRSRSLPE